MPEPSGRIPRVAVDDDTRDLLGRPGVGITRADPGALARTVVIIDQSSGATIGSRYLMTTRVGDELFGAIAVASRGVADAAGEVPDQLVPVGDQAQAEST